MASISAISVAEESSQPGELPEDLPYKFPPPGKTSEFDILTLNIVTDVVIIIAGDVAPTQAEEPVIDIGAKDIPVESSTEKVLIVKHVNKVIKHEAITVPNPDASVAISEMRQLLTQPAPALLAGTSVPPSTAKSVSIAIVETGSGSTPLVPTPAMDILEELSPQMVRQFFNHDEVVH